MQNLELAKRTLPVFTGTNGAYVCVRPSVASINLLAALQTALDLPRSVSNTFKLHCTVIWSKTVPTVNKSSPGLSFVAKVSGVDYWLGHDGQGYVVATLESPDLTDRHSFWKTLGASHSFEDYSPHVTLADDLVLTDDLRERLDLANKRFIGAYLTFSGETCVDVN